jgi:hypothetical protein
MPESGDWHVEQYAWVGPQVMTSDGLELHAVVAEDQNGKFHAGTRYGPSGGAMPELGHEEFWCMQVYKDRDAAIFAAFTDVTTAVRQADGRARTEALLERAASAKNNSKMPPAPERLRSIDR